MSRKLWVLGWLVLLVIVCGWWIILSFELP